jgi:two-component system response regulator NreC
MASIPLSPRESTVLHYLAWGYTNKEIAQTLNLSVKTVEAHKANGMRKLRTRSRAELVRYAVDAGWLAPGAVPSPASAASSPANP